MACPRPLVSRSRVRPPPRGGEGVSPGRPSSDLRLTTVRKWITDGRVVREEQRDASGGLTTRRASVAFAAR